MFSSRNWLPVSMDGKATAESDESECDSVRLLEFSDEDIGFLDDSFESEDDRPSKDKSHLSVFLGEVKATTSEQGNYSLTTPKQENSYSSKSDCSLAKENVLALKSTDTTPMKNVDDLSINNTTSSTAALKDANNSSVLASENDSFIEIHDGNDDPMVVESTSNSSIQECENISPPFNLVDDAGSLENKSSSDALMNCSSSTSCDSSLLEDTNGSPILKCHDKSQDSTNCDSRTVHASPAFVRVDNVSLPLEKYDSSTHSLGEDSPIWDNPDCTESLKSTAICQEMESSPTVLGKGDETPTSERSDDEQNETGLRSSDCSESMDSSQLFRHMARTPNLKSTHSLRTNRDTFFSPTLKSADGLPVLKSPDCSLVFGGSFTPNNSFCFQALKNADSSILKRDSSMSNILENVMHDTFLTGANNNIGEDFALDSSNAIQFLDETNTIEASKEPLIEDVNMECKDLDQSYNVIGTLYPIADMIGSTDELMDHFEHTMYGSPTTAIAENIKPEEQSSSGKVENDNAGYENVENVASVSDFTASEQGDLSRRNLDVEYVDVQNASVETLGYENYYYENIEDEKDHSVENVNSENHADCENVDSENNLNENIQKENVDCEKVENESYEKGDCGTVNCDPEDLKRFKLDMRSDCESEDSGVCMMNPIGMLTKDDIYESVITRKHARVCIKRIDVTGMRLPRKGGLRYVTESDVLNLEKPNGMVQCPGCEKSFAAWSKLQIHIHRQHMNIPLPFTCRYCKRYFLDECRFVDHLSMTHNRAYCKEEQQHARTVLKNLGACDSSQSESVQQFPPEALDNSKVPNIQDPCALVQETNQSSEALKDIDETPNIPSDEKETAPTQSVKDVNVPKELTSKDHISSTPSSDETSSSSQLVAPEIKENASDQQDVQARANLSTKPQSSRKKKRSSGINICPGCSKRFSSLNKLQGHINKQHRDLPLPFQCRYCKRSFIEEEGIKYHLSMTHNRAYTNEERLGARTAHGSSSSQRGHQRSDVSEDHENSERKTRIKTVKRNKTAMFAQRKLHNFQPPLGQILQAGGANVMPEVQTPSLPCKTKALQKSEDTCQSAEATENKSKRPIGSQPVEGQVKRGRGRPKKPRHKTEPLTRSSTDTVPLVAQLPSSPVSPKHTTATHPQTQKPAETQPQISKATAIHLQTRKATATHPQTRKATATHPQTRNLLLETTCTSNGRNKSSHALKISPKKMYGKRSRRKRDVLNQKQHL